MTIAFVSESRFPGTAEVLEGIDLHGKIALVTGGSGGIGLATAAALARGGADVIIAARPGAKLDAAAAGLATGARPATALGVDLADPDSIERFCDTVLASRDSIDILVNNAGIIGPKALSDTGVELGFMTNVVGHALLTSRLAPAMRDGGRIACLSSFGHHYSPVIFDDINFENRPYSAWSSYGQSKTGCALMAVKLSRELGKRGIDAFSLHPGAIYTDMGRSMGQEDYEMQLEKTGEIAAEDFMTPDQGAATTIWAVTSPALKGKGGLYLENCSVAVERDEPDYRTGVMRYAVDPELADRLWDVVAQMSGRELPLA